ncbi:hypothetical protein SNE40_015040 [Patella caerulea]|uniref:G-protein coupled receptors family 1 profile domain-containing protein n=1 Tax=Patella caerulea TaxID=87958 RepID=A0AAN8JLC0_PATCE
MNLVSEESQVPSHNASLSMDINISDTDIWNPNETIGECHMEPDNNIFVSTILPIVVCGGIVGIVLTVIVLGRKTMCTSTNCYLTTLAIADLLFLLLLSFKLLMERILGCIIYNRDEYILLSHYVGIFMNSSHIASIWVTVMLAVERYIAICYPLKAMSICTINRARCVLATICVLSFVCRVPNFFDVGIIWVTMNNETKAMWNWTSDTYDNTLYVLIVDVVLTAILPFVALTIFNIRLIVEIHKSSRYLRYHLAADSNVQTVISKEQMKITIMLIIIILAFFPCQGPFIVYHAIFAYNRFSLTTTIDDIFGSDQAFEQFKIATQILIALKSSLNFIIYCWFSEKFWNTFKRIFCLRYCVPKQLPKRNGHNSNNNCHRPSYLITRETTC